MANTVNIQKIVDGDKLSVIKVYLASDGVSGELSNQVIFDASALTGAANAANLITIDYAITGFSATLKWDATSPVPIMKILPDTPISHDFTFCGGIPNDAGTGITGDITLDTSGFTASGDSGFILIKVRKA
jgi:hypothetical protein